MGKSVKKEVQQSTLRYNLNHYEDKNNTKKYINLPFCLQVTRRQPCTPQDGI